MDTQLPEWPKNPYRKQYVPVRVSFREDGAMVPYALVWTDGREYAIGRIREIRSAPALRAGGQGDRYTVEICGKDRYLFFEHNPDNGSPLIGRWFVEAKNPI